MKMVMVMRMSGMVIALIRTIIIRPKKISELSLECIEKRNENVLVESSERFYLQLWIWINGVRIIDVFRVDLRSAVDNVSVAYRCRHGLSSVDDHHNHDTHMNHSNCQIHSQDSKCVLSQSRLVRSLNSKNNNSKF